MVDSLSSNANFEVSSGGIYFIPDPNSRGESSLRFFDFRSAKARTLLTTNKFMGWGLAVSPDERWLLYNSVEVQSDLMLLENFR